MLVYGCDLIQQIGSSCSNHASSSIAWMWKSLMMSAAVQSRAVPEGERFLVYLFFSSRRRHTRYWRDWSSDVCSSDLVGLRGALALKALFRHVARHREDAGHAPVGDERRRVRHGVAQLAVGAEQAQLDRLRLARERAAEALDGRGALRLLDEVAEVAADERLLRVAAHRGARAVDPHQAPFGVGRGDVLARALKDVFEERLPLPRDGLDLPQLREVADGADRADPPGLFDDRLGRDEQRAPQQLGRVLDGDGDRKSTRLNSSHA